MKSTNNGIEKTMVAAKKAATARETARIAFRAAYLESPEGVAKAYAASSEGIAAEAKLVTAKTNYDVAKAAYDVALHKAVVEAEKAT